MGPIYRLLTAGLLTAGLLSPAAQATEKPAGTASADKPASAYLVDVSAPHWCFDCLQKIVNHARLMDGYADHTFRGDWKISRFGLAAVTSKLLHQIRLSQAIPISPQIQREGLIPALPEHWAYPYVRMLRQEYDLAALLFEDPTVKGDQPASRKHVAYVLTELLMRAEGASGRDLGEGIRLAQKAIDTEERSPYTPYIEAALNRFQFMNLYADHTFRPEYPVSRYELAAALCRIQVLLETRLVRQSPPTH
jgi:hypothetical protein